MSNFRESDKATSNSPLIKQVDHIAVRVNEPEYLFSLFTDMFGLPVAWQLADYSYFRSGAVIVGNANLEFIRIGNSTSTINNCSSEAKFFGIAFEPFNSLTDSLDKLASRDIPHSPPTPFWGKNEVGTYQRLWTNVLLGQLLVNQSNTFYLGKRLSGNTWLNRWIGKVAGAISNTSWGSNLLSQSLGDSMIFICDYNHDVNARRAIKNEAFKRCQGGKLGLKGVQEIVISTTNIQQARINWCRLLEPIHEVDENCWQPDTGAAIRLVSGSEDKIKTLVLKVISLEKVKVFLEQNHFLKTLGEREVAISLDTVQGLDIRFVEYSEQSK